MPACPFVCGLEQLSADPSPTVAGMYGDLFDMGMAVYDAQEEIRNRALLLVWIDEGTTPALESGKFLDGARIVVGDRVHIKIAEYGSGCTLNLDEEREFVPAGRTDHRGCLSVAARRRDELACCHWFAAWLLPQSQVQRLQLVHPCPAPLA